MKLTRDEDKLICVLYREYLKAIDNGAPREKATAFGHSVDIQKSLLPGIDPEQVAADCIRLRDEGFIGCFQAKNIAYTVQLENKGIRQMEKRFPKGLEKLEEYMVQTLEMAQDGYALFK
ncbi:MAG: hypothetical protein FWC96_04445 [Oscillospiraceae bacterium]|nr:hypothetical protein [Oscillospiraceae bacterium]